MEDRLTRILRAKKMKGVNWDEIAEKLPIGSNGLRAAFSRGSVDENYLDVIEDFLQINTSNRNLDSVNEPIQLYKPEPVDTAIVKLIDNVYKPIIDKLRERVESLEGDVKVLMQHQLQKDLKHFSSKTSSEIGKASNGAS